MHPSGNYSVMLLFQTKIYENFTEIYNQDCNGIGQDGFPVIVIFARFLEIFVLNLNYSWKIC